MSLLFILLLFTYIASEVATTNTIHCKWVDSSRIWHNMCEDLPSWSDPDINLHKSTVTYRQGHCVLWYQCMCTPLRTAVLPHTTLHVTFPVWSPKCTVQVARLCKSSTTLTHATFMTPPFRPIREAERPGSQRSLVGTCQRIWRC